MFTNSLSNINVAVQDVVLATARWEMWNRLDWREVTGRYRRTVIGPFWTTLSVGIFIFVLGILWSTLWGKDPKEFLP